MSRAQYVIISGASKGLGLTLARNLLETTDFRVIGFSRQPTTAMPRLVEEFDNRFEYHCFDLANLSEIAKFVTKITEKKEIYSLINNAAVPTRSILATMHEREIFQVVNVNVVSTILLTKYVARKMLRNRAGRIINISSVVSHTGYNGLAVYGATKSALIGFTKSLARELGNFHITVNSVSPGFMETEMSESLGDKLEQIKRRSPIGQLTSTRSVADYVNYLLGESACHVTGHDYVIDAGNSC